jgi:hypothetical protein
VMAMFRKHYLVQAANTTSLSPASKIRPAHNIGKRTSGHSPSAAAVAEQLERLRRIAKVVCDEEAIVTLNTTVTGAA